MKIKNEMFQSLLLLVLSFNDIDKEKDIDREKELGFNPYYYWSYLLTWFYEIKKWLDFLQVSILIITGLIF